MTNKFNISIHSTCHQEQIKEFYLVDYFDTIAHRHCHPDAVKMLWAKNMVENYTQFSAPYFYQVRLEAEQYVAKYSSFQHEAPYRVLTDEIYSRLIYQLSDTTTDEFYENCLEADIVAECSVQYLDQDTINQIRQAKQEQKKVVVITDFYLPRAAFERFFVNLGIEEMIDECFVSSDLDARKSDGSLYDHVLEILSCTGHCSMTGDNFHSDYEIPIKKGISAIHKPNEVSYPAVPTEEVLRKGLLQLKKQSKADLFNGYAFYFYYFTEQLFQELTRKNIRDVFFLAREGQPLKRMFDWYQQQKGINNIHSHYLCASRASTLLASCNALEEESFSKYFNEYSDVAPSDFLHSHGFDGQEIQCICEDAGIRSDKIIKRLSGSEEMCALRKSKVFSKLYKKKREEQRSGFISYLDTFGVNYQDQGLCIVDVGWKGSIQDNIFNILDKKVIIDGYYIGLTGKTFTDYRNKKTGIVFSHFPCRSKYCDWFEQQTFLIEQLLSADHGPTVRYEKSKQGYVPVLEADEKNDMVFRNVSPIQKGWESTMQQIYDLFRYSCYDSGDMVQEFAKIQLKNVLLRTSRERRLKQKLIQNSSNNFGTSSGKTVQRSTKDKLRYFIRSFRSADGSQTLKVMYLLEQITGKLHCSWIDRMIEYWVYSRMIRSYKKYCQRGNE